MRNNSTLNGLNRRNLLRKVGTAAGIGVLGAGSVGSASGASSSDTWNQGSADIEVTNIDTLGEQQTNQGLDSVLSSNPVQKAQDAFNKKGLQTLTAPSFSVTTDDPEVNARDPIFTMPTFSIKNKNRSDHRMGSLNVLSMDTEKGRQPVGGIGFALDDDKRGDLSPDGNMGNGILKAFGLSDTQPVQKVASDRQAVQEEATLLC